jgi:type III secretory pathway component EscS
MSRQTPDYGLDAPGAVYAAFVVGLAGAIIGFVPVWTSSRHVSLAYAVQIVGVCFVILAALML